MLSRRRGQLVDDFFGLPLSSLSSSSTHTQSVLTAKMAEVETLGILQDIDALVSDRLQVVSYKWLSRNYLVSSNVAKRLLQDFVEKCEASLQVVYTLSGWLKKDPLSYHVKLVCGPKLAEARQDFVGNCSAHVYSVQACIPKDPAALWNSEFVQAEELFKQPLAVDNCLRDNRFCGITNSFVKRNVEGVAMSSALLPSKSAGGNGQLKSDMVHKKITVPQPQEDKVQEYDPKLGVQAAVKKEVSTECNATGSHQANKHPSNEEKFNSLPGFKKKAQNDKNSSSTGSSLASMWGRASAKSKPCYHGDANKIVPVSTASSAEAQICAREAVESLHSDDDHEDVKLRKASNGEGNRKRRVVFDFSDDEYEDTVDLGLPDNPPRVACQDPDRGTFVVSETTSGNSGKQLDDKQMFKGDGTPERESVAEKVALVTTKKLEAQSCLHDKDLKNDDKSTNAAPTSPKRRKVLKTHIDERGREVTEVIWEGEGTEAKKEEISLMKNSSENTVKNSVINRPRPAKKSPALGSNASSKAGSKKGGTGNNPKQGNILSFFKKV